MRVLTNRRWLDGRIVEGRRIETQRLAEPAAGTGALLRAFALWRYDAVLADCDIGGVFVSMIARVLMPWSRCRIMVVDPVLTRPGPSLTSRAKFRLRRWLLRRVDRFVLYFRDTAELQRVYGIPDEKIRYVPFKPNTLDRLAFVPRADEGFFLACGRSNRDFATLFDAFRALPELHCRVLAPWNELEQHGTRVDGAERPSNVTLVSDDGSADSWNRWIGRATAVVLPIEPGMLSPSGIGTYLVAMALGKCVVITEGPAARGLVDRGEAVLVPPKDACALRDAVRRVAGDAAYRASVAARGQEYALSLGGEERLRRDVLAELAGLVATQGGEGGSAGRKSL